MEAEDPKSHRSANGRSVVSTHTMEIHYEHASTMGNLIATPMMSVLNWKTVHTDTQSIGKQESADDMRGGQYIQWRSKGNRAKYLT